MPGQNSRPGGGAGGSGMVLVEAKALPVKRIQVGRLNEGVSMAPHRGISLIIGQDENDVGAFGRHSVLKG